MNRDIVTDTLMPSNASSDFKATVLEIVGQIPEGTTLTYKQVAERAGRPRAYRAVGTIMSHNWDPRIPCHRVVRSDGQPGGYNRGEEAKRHRLLKEGALTQKAL